MVRGRGITDRDRLGTPKVVVINEALARKYFPNEDPLGKQFGNSTLAPDSLKEIIGIVEDIHEGALNADIWPAVYSALESGSDPVRGGRGTDLRRQRAGGTGGARAGHSRDRSGLRHPSPLVMRQRIQDSPGGLPAAVFGLAGRRVRGDGAAAGRHRALRRDRVLGEPADARDRPQAGARCGASDGVRVDSRGSGAIDCGRPRHRRRGIGGRRRADAYAALRHQPWDVPTLIGVAAVLGIAAASWPASFPHGARRR